MKSQINLASRFNHEKRKLNKFTITAIVTVGVVFIAALVLLAYSLSLNSEMAVLDVEYQQLTNAMRQMSSQKGKALVLGERITAINQVLFERIDFNTTLQKITADLPTSLRIATLDATKDRITMKVVTANLSDINSLFQEKIDKVIKDPAVKFKRVLLDSFGIDTNGQEYYASLNFQKK